MTPSPESGIELELPPDDGGVIAYLLAKPWFWWAVAAICAALLVALGVYLWPRAKKYLALRKAKRSREEDDQLGVHELSRSWDLFIKGVPAELQNTLVNYEHVVVAGPSRSGKRELIEHYSDYLAQSNQGIKSLVEGNSLQVYVGSGVLITELPAGLLSADQAQVREALTALWKPLYRERLPAFVVAVDVLALARMPEADIDTLAQKLRGQANALSAVGQKPVRVRVIANRLEQLEGWTELAALLQDAGIPLHIPLVTGSTKSEDAPLQQFVRWLASVREQLPRVLTQLDPAAFFKVVRFLRLAETDAGAPVFENFAHFLDGLFQPQASSLAPINDGVFMASPSGSSPNPLRNPDASGRVLHPLARHLRRAGVAAAAVVAFAAGASVLQDYRLEKGQVALDHFLPQDGSFDENALRSGPSADITSAACEPLLPLFDLQGRKRKRLRQALSERVRHVLVAKLVDVDQPPLVLGPEWLRIAAYLALIHSSSSDYFEIDSSRDSMLVWTSATGLSAKLIKSYLQATDTARREPVGQLTRSVFKLDDVNDKRQGATWYEVIRDGLKAIEAGSITPDALAEMSQRALVVKSFRGKPDQERIALEIYAALDEAVIYDSTNEPEQWQAEVVTGRATEFCSKSREGEVANTATRAAKLETSYAPLFQSHANSINYHRLCKQHREVVAILDEIAMSSVPTAKITNLSALNDALEQLIESPGAADRKKLPVALEKQRSTDANHEFDSAAWRKMTIGAQATRLVELLASAEGADIFAGAGGRSGSAVEWNTSRLDRGPFIGHASIPFVFSRAYYERYVRSELVRYEAALAKLGVALDPATDQRMRGFLSGQVRTYALGYVSALRTFASAFDVAPSLSPTALRVVLTQLAAESSPFSYYVSAVSDQAGANTDGTYLGEMAGALEEFAGWQAMNDGKGGGELQKYRAILAQLALELGPDKEEAEAPEPSKESVATLEASLSALGRVALREILVKKGAYRPLIAQWLESVELPLSQAQPFFRPIVLLRQIGATEITQAVGVAWRRELRPGLVHLARKFPFDPRATDDVTPDELSAELDPLKGSFFAGVRNFVEPISALGAGRPFTQHASLEALVTVPPDMYPTINALAGLSARLFDAQGKPKPLSVAVRTVPLSRGEDAESALTAAFVGVDDASFYAFNQRTTDGALPIDWTREQIAQVGGQYTHLKSRRTTFSEPLTSESSYWSLLRLLQLAEVDVGSSRVGGTTYTWRIAGPNAASQPGSVRFRVVNDPWKYFTLPLSKSELGAGS